MAAAQAYANGATLSFPQTEWAIAQRLAKKKIAFVHQQLFLHPDQTAFVVDFFLPQLHVVIEIDGKEHRYKKNDDERRDAVLAAQNIRTIRVQDTKNYKDMWQIIMRALAKQ
jgi:very-short-patch-repair endonuclease